MKQKTRGWVLLPFLVFVGLYLFVGIYLTMQGNDEGFYAMPASISVIAGLITAFVLYRGSVDEKFATLIKGCGEDNIIIMCLIFLLAGAFGSVTNAIGGVDSVVNFGLRLIPMAYIVPGMFLIACFVCLSIGTSMGTIATMAPICVALADKSGINLALILATLLSGAMFGNNMSIIADTTIVASRTLGVEIRQKFKANLLITVPAVLVALVGYYIAGRPYTSVAVAAGPYDLWTVLPYIVVLVLALIGVNVFVVLMAGILLAGALGIILGKLTFLGFTDSIQAGFNGMFDVLLFSLLIGGLAYMVKEEGGIAWINEKLKRFIVGRKSAQLMGMLLPGLVDVSIANDTVSALVTGPIIKDIAEHYKIDKRYMASLMHSTVCIFQSTLPYGAQILLVTSIANKAVSPLQVIPYLWYGFAGLLVAIVTIFLPQIGQMPKEQVEDLEQA